MKQLAFLIAISGWHFFKCAVFLDAIGLIHRLGSFLNARKMCGYALFRIKVC